MRKFALITLLLSLAVCTTVQAQIQYPNLYKEWEVAGLFGAAFVGDQSSETPVEGQDMTRLVGLDYSSGFLMGIRLTQNLKGKMGAELDYTYANQPLTFLNLSPTIPKLSVSHRVHSFVYSILYYFGDRNSRVRPFVSVGAGASLFQIDGTSKFEALARGVDLNDTWKFVGSFGGGVKYMINDSIGIRFDVRDLLSGVPSYSLPRTSSVDDDGTIGPAFRPDGILSDWQFSGGILFTWGGY